MTSKKWLARACLFLCIIAAFSCSRFKKKDEKQISFEVFVPLIDDYALLSKGIVAEIENIFPKAKITMVEGLSDKYEIPPFADWITRASTDAFLKLRIKTDRPEDLAHVTAFLNAEESKIPFKVKIPKLELEGSEGRGQALFCRLRIEGTDLFEQQLCRELVQSLCGKEPPKKALPNPPHCELSFVRPETTQASTGRPKEFFLTSFPLPLRVRGEYPLTRFGESDEATLQSLF